MSPQVKGGGTGPRSRLGRLVAQWENLDEQIKAIVRGEQPNPSAGDETREDRLRDKRRALAESIRGIVDRHPELAQVAADLGFNPRLLTPVEPSGPPGKGVPGREEEDEERAEREERRDTPPTSPPPLVSPPTTPPKDPQPRGNSNRWLPGIKGKDFDVVRYGGKTYVVYKVKHAGNFTMRVPADKFKAYGIRENEGRQLTKAQFKRLNQFGSAADILVHGENRHPFRQWIEQTEALYGGTGMLKNKEVMRVFLEGYVKGWSPEVIQGQLRQTNWADKTTEYQRNWGFLGTAEKKGQIESFSLRITESLKEIYGDEWLKHFPDYDKKWLKTKAKQIATGVLGAMGDPQGSLEAFIRNQTNRAEKIEGTPAWIAKQQREAERGEFLGRPENLREDLRQQAIQMLGYAGKDVRLDGDTLTKWSERIAYAQLNREGNPYTQADFDRWLRRQKQALYPELDPDEAWQDATSVRKAKAEDLLGLSLSWNDKLLTSVPFGAVDETGKPLGRRMSDLEYERLIRQDERFWDSPTAAQEGFGLLQRLQETFQGGVI